MMVSRACFQSQNWLQAHRLVEEVVGDAFPAMKEYCEEARNISYLHQLDVQIAGHILINAFNSSATL